VSVGVMVVLCALSDRQLSYWRDNITLWSHALEVTQGNFLAENNLGKALLQQGRLEEGAVHFYRAAEIYPNDPVSNFNIGIYEQKRGHYSSAIQRYQTTLNVTRDPELRAAAARNMAAANSQMSGVSGAIQK
jgi:tetratricopeptide (TPR) repeat protein